MVRSQNPRYRVTPKFKGQHVYDVSMIMTYLLVVVVGIGVVVGGGTFTAKIINTYRLFHVNEYTSCFFIKLCREYHDRTIGVIKFLRCFIN